MPRPPQTNPFPTSPLSQIWDTVIDALQNDPTLHSAVNTWQVNRGDVDDLQLATDEDMPLFIMMPMSGQSQWLDEKAHQFRWPIRIQLGVLGTDARVMMDYWYAVHRALFTENTVLYTLYPFEVIQKSFTSPAVEPHLWGAVSGLSATAMLSILLRLHS